MKSSYWKWTAGRLAVGLLSLTLGASLAAAAKRGSDAGSRCSVRNSAAGLQVRCPNATVAELLGALRQTTGLRSEYPAHLGNAPVSVSVRRGSLQQVVGSALAAYNFAVWKDPAAPSVTWLRIVGLRQAPAGGEHQVVAYHDASALPEAGETSAVTLLPSRDEEEMARVRESFARSVKPAPGLQPIPEQ